MNLRYDFERVLSVANVIKFNNLDSVSSANTLSFIRNIKTHKKGK